LTAEFGLERLRRRTGFAADQEQPTRSSGRSNAPGIAIGIAGAAPISELCEYLDWKMAAKTKVQRS
jgi:hypothetical protein